MTRGPRAGQAKIKTTTRIRLFGTADDSIVDGPGIRFAIFTQGCRHQCPGCHNPDAQAFAGGYDIEVGELKACIEANPLLSGVTLSGGEPFEQAESLLELARWIHEHERPLTLWAYSGYTFEELRSGTPSHAAALLLKLCDVLVDGPFIKEQQSYLLKWRGSANQRIIDVPASLEAGAIVTFSKGC